MAYSIGPLREDELPELSRFLTAGFRTTSDAPFAAVDVLRWKYFEGPEQPPRSLVARAPSGEILGHAGLRRSQLAIRHPRESAISTRVVTATHVIDLLASPKQRGVGFEIVKIAHEEMPIGFVLGGSRQGRRTGVRMGYLPRPSLPVFRRPLRPWSALRDNQGGPWQTRLMRASRDLLTHICPRVQPGPRLTLQRVDRFDSWVEGVQRDSFGGRILIATAHTPESLNWLLDYPRGGISGWRIEIGSNPDLIGFALLSIVPHGSMRVGKIAELILTVDDPPTLASAYQALAAQLHALGADFALACASTDWFERALTQAGFARKFELDVAVRDPGHLLPDDLPHVIQFQEADYATLP